VSYTKLHAAQNVSIRAVALPALHEVGWQPEPEPRNWSALAENATYLVLREFPDVSFQRVRHQVIAVMMEYRGKSGAWA